MKATTNTNTLQRVLLMLLVAVLFTSSVSAAQLGVNYYHETMMTARWGNKYIDRTPTQVGQDLDDIKTVANNVKFFMNPFVNGNLAWVQTVSAIAEQKGMHTVVTMMVDDRQLDNGNWWDYSNRVVQACGELNGKVDEVLVGNEISLHSSMSRGEIQDKVVELINKCKQQYSGTVSYQAFWYEYPDWQGYNGRIYFMHYESLGNFKTNVNDMNSKFGANGAIGEWGEDLYDEGAIRDEIWQREQIRERLAHINTVQAPVAYLFSYREPSWTGFGMLRADGSKKALWEALPKTGSTSQPSPQPTPSQSPAPTEQSSLDVQSLGTRCTYDGGNNCLKKSDNSDNTCRYVTYGTARGDVKVTACEKQGGIEIYRNQFPTGMSFKACFDNSCVDQYTGFVRYSSTAQAPTEPTQTPGSTGAINMESLGYSCQANGQGCWVKSDTTSSTCRTMTFGSNSGDLRVQGCDKGSGVIEMYKLQAPNTAYSVCLANGCITQDSGFSKFTLGTTSSPTQPTTGGVNGLPVTASPNGRKVGDFAEGTTCRKVQYTTDAGWVESRICQKNGNNYEMYLLSGANDANICVSGNCVGAAGGFKAFSY